MGSGIHFCRTERCGRDSEFAGASSLWLTYETHLDAIIVHQPVVERIAAILRDRYEPFAAERVALRILECIQSGDKLSEHLTAVPISAAKARPR